jgi:hypothetical protein
MNRSRSVFVAALGLTLLAGSAQAAENQSGVWPQNPYASS